MSEKIKFDIDDPMSLEKLENDRYDSDENTERNFN